ncbi:rubredoxin [Agaribacillus aureus]|uniref:rubredoxin n=1 Tax=Agaribacillus aureus TaxID=3051825 RepID=UPI003211AD2F
MITKKDLVRVFVKGGILSPGDFLKIIKTANKLGSDSIHFGSRQDILFPVKNYSKEDLDKTFDSIQTNYEINQESYQNIVSSYVALDVLPRKSWLAPHIYHYILDSFKYRPKFKINIVDPSQSLVPLFTGNLNFVASSQDNYWFLYLRFSEIDPNPWKFPALIYGFDLAKVAEFMESLDFKSQKIPYEDLYSLITKTLKINLQTRMEEMNFPDSNFPYYEGLNSTPDGKYWLGLYWRNNKFDTTCLRAICERCIKTNVGKVSLTPWKSIIIKGIEEKYRIGWEKLLGRFGINMRHSSLELNWHLPVLDTEALNLKNYLVREMDKMDISTYGLTFSIKNDPAMVPFTSVVIEKNFTPDSNPGESYNILFSKEFNANLMEYDYYTKNVSKDIIPPLLLELSYLYYEQLDEKQKVEKETGPKNNQKTLNILYQCKNCLTIYDERIGDEINGIKPGVAFEKLPNTYECPLCGSDKKGFSKIS